MNHDKIELFCLLSLSFPMTEYLGKSVSLLDPSPNPSLVHWTRPPFLFLTLQGRTALWPTLLWTSLGWIRKRGSSDEVELSAATVTQITTTVQNTNVQLVHHHQLAIFNGFLWFCFSRFKTSVTSLSHLFNHYITDSFLVLLGVQLWMSFGGETLSQISSMCSCKK